MALFLSRSDRGETRDCAESGKPGKLRKPLEFLLRNWRGNSFFFAKFPFIFFGSYVKGQIPGKSFFTKRSNDFGIAPGSRIQNKKRNSQIQKFGGEVTHFFGHFFQFVPFERSSFMMGPRGRKIFFFSLKLQFAKEVA